MARVNRKTIEKIFFKIDENFLEKEYSDQLEYLQDYEMWATHYNKEGASQITSINVSFGKIKYYVARLYSEGKNKRTLIVLKRHLDDLEDKILYLTNYKGDETFINMIKDSLTYFEIGLGLDISFYTSLTNLYEVSLEKKTVCYKDIQNRYERSGR